LLHLFAFEKFIYAGIIAYQSKNFAESQSLFEKALLINPTDFTTNFWLLRTTALQGNFDVAIQSLNVCKQCSVISKVENLIKPWDEYCSSPTTNPQQVELLNKHTDELLEYYQHFREFHLLDILKSFLMILISGSIVYVVMPKDTSLVVLSSLFILIIAPLMIIFYYRKTTIIPSFFVLFYYCLHRIRKLFSSNNFINTSLVVIIGILVAAKWFPFKALGSTKNYATIITAIVLTPIYEEIFFRGVLYGYLKKHGKPLAWALATLIFYWTHGDSAAYSHIILSCAALYIYDSEKTILAPILVHSMYNGIILLHVILY